MKGQPKTATPSSRSVGLSLFLFAMMAPGTAAGQETPSPAPEPVPAPAQPAQPAPPAPAPAPPQQYPPQQYPPQQYPPQQYPPQQYPPQQYPPQQYPPQQYPPQQYPPQQYPPQQYPPQQYPPQQYPPQQYPPQQAVVPAASPPAARRARQDLGKLVNFRFGWNMYGTGTLRFEGECSGDCPLTTTNESTDAADHTRMLLGLDLLFGREPLQIGFGLWFMPHVTLEPASGVGSGHADKDLGFEFTTPFIFGGLVPINDHVSLSLKAFAGPQVLFGGGDGAIEQDVDAYESFCDSTPRSLEDCDASAETRLGLTPGAGTGALFRAGSLVSMSAELMVQYTNLSLFSFDAEGNGWSAHQSYGYEGLRFWLVLGVGLGG